jgi:hypothetical protein
MSKMSCHILRVIDSPLLYSMRMQRKVKALQAGMSRTRSQVRHRKKITYFNLIELTDELSPTLIQLSALHNFTIESQVQLYAPLEFESVKLESDGSGLTPDQLSVFVNSAEWTLCECRYGYNEDVTQR